MYHQTAQFFLIRSSLQKRQFYKPDTGRFLKSIDKGLPNDHTSLIYDKRPKADAVYSMRFRRLLIIKVEPSSKECRAC